MPFVLGNVLIILSCDDPQFYLKHGMKSDRMLEWRRSDPRRGARNPTGQDHVAARLPRMIHGFLEV